MELVTDGCIIRPWRSGDDESLVLHANDKDVWINLRDGFPYPYTLRDARDWILLANSTDPVTNFAIEVSGQAAGGIGLSLQSDVHRRSAEIGYWLGKKYWGQGIMSHALHAMADYAFVTYDLCRLYAAVFEWNPASARVLEKCGFEREATLRKAITKNGKTVDALLYACVR